MSCSPFREPIFKIILPPLSVEPFLFLLARFFLLLLGLCALPGLNIGFHKSLVALLFQTSLVQLLVGDIQQREGLLFGRLLGLFNPEIFVSGFLDGTFQVPDQSIEVGLILQILRFQNAPHLLLGLRCETAL